jgi:xylan 1,4-beta-xylosidase
MNRTPSVDVITRVLPSSSRSAADSLQQGVRAGRRRGVWRASLVLAAAATVGLSAWVAAQPPPASAQPSASADGFAVQIRVDAAKSSGPLKQIWRFFGADEPNYAYMKDGQKLIADIGQLAPKRMYFRAHSLLVTGDGTPALKWGSTNAYREDAQGNPIYDWTIVDRIFDTYLARGVKPYVQIGFMPEAMSIKPQPYKHAWTPLAKYDEIYTGWAYPPKDYRKWGDLVHAWAKHCVEKYGRAEVEQWYWETWNEANIGYWRGTPEEFRKLHDYAIDGVRRALPTARVGGPDTAGHGGQFSRDFFEHQLRGTNHVTGRTGTPIDFVSFHAKGRPEFVDGHVRLGIANQLATIDEGFRIVASFPELKPKPIVIGESDPDGCAACQGPQLGYRNTTMYSSYTAASFARKHDLAERHGVNLEGALTWAFEFEDQPYFAGFRVMASNGLTLPVFNVFRMFSRMGAQRLAATSDGAADLDVMMKAGVRQKPDVAALASRDDRRVTVLAWHYHDDDVPGPAADVSLSIDGLDTKLARVKVQHFRIDAAHSNAYTAWQRLGSPASPTAAQYKELEQASGLTRLTGAPDALDVASGRAALRFTLPRQAVSLVVVEW